MTQDWTRITRKGQGQHGDSVREAELILFARMRLLSQVDRQVRRGRGHHHLVSATCCAIDEWKKLLGVPPAEVAKIMPQSLNLDHDRHHLCSSGPVSALRKSCILYASSTALVHSRSGSMARACDHLIEKRMIAATLSLLFFRNFLVRQLSGTELKIM